MGTEIRPGQDPFELLGRLPSPERTASAFRFITSLFAPQNARFWSWVSKNQIRFCERSISSPGLSY